MMIWTSTSIGLCSVSKIILVWTQSEYFWVADLITAFEPLQRLDALNHCRLPDIPNMHLNNRCYRMCQTKTILYVFSACFLLNYRRAEPTKDLSGMEENTDTCLKWTSRTSSKDDQGCQDTLVRSNMFKVVAKSYSVALLRKELWT